MTSACWQPTKGPSFSRSSIADSRAGRRATKRRSSICLSRRSSPAAWAESSTIASRPQIFLPMAFLRRPIRSINSSSLERPSSSNPVGWSSPRRCPSCSGRMDRRFPTNFFDREAAKAPSDEFALNLDARELPLIRADTYLNDLLLKYCEAALADRRSDTSELRTRVENAISTMLPHGRVLVEDVARSLRMSERTLARKLSDEGLNFTDVLQQVRRDLAV